MAAKETFVNNDRASFEPTINRWLLDYYLFRALDVFKKHQYEEFCGIRDVLNSVLVRSVEFTDVMPAKIQVFQLLCLINDGEKHDLSLESDPAITPLESALMLLGEMNQEHSIPQRDFENVYASVTEMIVAIYIRNSKFDKAKEILNKHFPKPMVGKKAIFMGLISQKSEVHGFTPQISFQQLRDDVLAFCQKLCQFTVPFLHKAAEELIHKKKQKDKAAETEERAKSGPSSHLQVNAVHFLQRKYSVIQRVRLEAAYKALAADTENRTFAMLEEEVEREDLVLLHPTDPKRGTNPDPEQEGLFQSDSGSPMEASPADLPSQTDGIPETQASSLSETPSALWGGQLYSVPRLVVEPDSQVSSQCTTDSPEQKRTEKPQPSLARSSKKDLECPVSDRGVDAPIRKCPRRSNRTYCRASTSAADLSADRENTLDSVTITEINGAELHNQSNRSEEDPLELSASCKTPVQRPQEQLAGDPLSTPVDPGNMDTSITESSLDGSPSLHPVPQTSSTPHRDSPQHSRSSQTKWKKLFNDAKESKDTWSDEESYFTSKKKDGTNQSIISNSGGRRKMWTESETQKLKEGVKKFGEGNWAKIRAYYSFSDRTNVNLKDRWRTLKKLNMA